MVLLTQVKQLENKVATGLSISEVMDNHRYALNGVPVEYEGISYIARNVRKDGLVELYLGLQNDQPDMIISTDLVYLKGD